MRKQCCFASVCIVLSLLLGACGGDEAPATATAVPAIIPTVANSPAVETPDSDMVQPDEIDEPTAVPTEAPPTVVPTPDGPQALVVDVVNEVNAHPLPAGEWESAWVDMTIFMGGEVWAEEQATAMVGVDDGVIRVAPNSIFSFGQPQADTVTLNLQEGQIWLNVEGLEGEKTFEVETPNAVASVRGTRFSVRSYPDEGTLVSTQVGTVTLGVENQRITVTAGFESTAPLIGPPSEVITMSTQEELRWGMAAGDDLDVVLPTGSSLFITTLDGQMSNPHLSQDGTYFTAYYYYTIADDTSTYQGGSIIYDVQASDLVTGMVPMDADGVQFSPDGEWVAYQEYADGDFQICTIHVTDTISNCFGGDAFYGWPYWSPDGEWLTFYSEREYTTTNIYRARPDGSELLALTSGADSIKDAPEWSPDGTQIAYLDKPTDYEQPADLWVVNADGSDPRLVKEGVYRYHHAQWAPDSSSLVTRGFDGGLYLVPLDGEAPRIIPGTDEWHCYDPLWGASSTGWPLYFHYVDPDSYQRHMYYVLDDSSTPVPFASSTHWGPIWSADGRWAAFGNVDKSGDIPLTTIYFFEMVTDFYP